MAEMWTELVAENFEPVPGRMDTRHFWIAGPSAVLAQYGQMSDRISHATGRGPTKAAALKAAERSLAASAEDVA